MGEKKKKPGKRRFFFAQREERYGDVAVACVGAAQTPKSRRAMAKVESWREFVSVTGCA